MTDQELSPKQHQERIAQRLAAYEVALEQTGEARRAFSQAVADAVRAGALEPDADGR